MYRFLGQQKFLAVDNTFQQVGFELFLRKKTMAGYQLPRDFLVLTPSDLAKPLALALQPIPQSVQFISINLEPVHFVRPDFIRMAIDAQELFNTNLVVELVERTDPDVTIDQLVTAAKQYRAAGIGVCLDDVGTDCNTGSRVDTMDPYVTEYKFAMQNLRPFNDMTKIATPLMYWYNRAKRQRKDLAIEGIETQAEFDYVNAHCPGVILQGYFFARPALLPIAG